MNIPRYEPEIVRAKVVEAIRGLRDDLRQMGWTEDEIWALTWTVEQRALKYALAPDADDVSG